MSLLKPTGILERIKEALTVIHDRSILLLPPSRVEEHPFEALREDMEEVMQVLEGINQRLGKRIEATKKGIEASEAKMQRLCKILDKQPPQKDHWMHKESLAYTESILALQVSDLEALYAQKAADFRLKKERIRYLLSEIDECPNLPILLENQEPTQSRVGEAEKTIRELEVKLGRIKEQSKKNKEEVLRLLGVLEIPFASPARVFQTLTDITDCLENNGNISLTVPEHTGLPPYGNVSVLNGTSISDTRRMLASLAQVQARAKKRVEELKQRIETLQHRLQQVPVHSEPQTSPNILKEVGAQQRALGALEDVYRSQIQSILQKHADAIKESASVIRNLTKQEPSTHLPEKVTEINSMPFEEQEQILTRLESQAAALQKESSILTRIQGFTEERRELLRKMSEFEEQASDPGRLFRSSFQLLSEEKFRKMAVPTLLRVEREILALAEEYAQVFSREPRFGDKMIVQDLKKEISARIINPNVFITGRTSYARAQTPGS